MPDLRALFWPRSIALVGASANKTIIRGRIVEAVGYHGFAGPIYPVSRSNDEIDGMKCYPSVDALPETVDLAIITIPAPHVAAALEACGARGVKAVIVISSGFAEERGGEGARRQQELVEITKAESQIQALAPAIEEQRTLEKSSISINREGPDSRMPAIR